MGKNYDSGNDNFESLKAEFDKLMISNPYFLKILGKCKIKLQHEDGYTECDYGSVYNKFRMYDTLRMIAFFLVGIAFSAIILFVVYHVNKGVADQEERCQIVLSFMYKSTPYVCFLFSSIIGCFCFFLRVVGKEDIRPSVLIIIFFLQGLITLFSSIWNQELMFYICPIAAFIAVFFYLSIIYAPLSSKKLNGTIISNAKKIQEKIDSINIDIIQKSHSQVLDQIKQVEKIVMNGDWNMLYKMQSLTVLDSLRLELIQNSINGINLVEDWKYLDLSQKMIDDIMLCNNKKVTILGDLSFLSTEDGLEKLVNAITIKKKVFDIYFTGRERNGFVESEHCENLVHLIRRKYLNDEKEFNIIKDHINLNPILSQSFTGIGYIGLHKNEDNSNVVRFDKVYAYVSSHLIEEKDIDITRANPFVFTWSSGQLSYFEEFMKNIISTNQLKVMIDGQPKERTEILSFKLKKERKCCLPTVKKRRKG